MMFYVNDHPIKTIEDILWVFEPDEIKLDYLGQEHQHRAFWDRGTIGTDDFEYLEIGYQDGATYDIRIWTQLVIGNKKYNADAIAIDINETLSCVLVWFEAVFPTRRFHTTPVPPFDTDLDTTQRT